MSFRHRVGVQGGTCRGLEKGFDTDITRTKHCWNVKGKSKSAIMNSR